MLRALPGGRAREPEAASADKLALLQVLERKVLWLSTWMIHNANHLRPSRDGLKVGGHQASSASVATLMTALYLDVMRPQDRVAVKPHAAPVFHALQYLLGQQTREKLEGFRALGGAQAYPSRSKDGDIVDFSTGSVGLGVGVTLFAALVQDYLRLHRLTDTPPGRMIALAGDAELDGGNIFEALLQGWKHDDAALGALMTNLAGHDMGSVLDAFHGVTDDQPTCFIAYTIKGYGLPFAGHKDNHAGLMNPQQMALLQESMAVPAGAEWEPFVGLDRPAEELADFLAHVPLAAAGGRPPPTPPHPPPPPVPAAPRPPP